MCVCAHCTRPHWHMQERGAGGLGRGGVGGGAKTQPVLFHVAVAPSPLPLMTERGTYGGFSRSLFFTFYRYSTGLVPVKRLRGEPGYTAHTGRTDTRITQTNLTTIPQTLTNHPDPQTHTRTTARRARSRPSPRSPVLSTVPVPVYRFKNTGGSRDTKPTDTQNPDVYG